MIGETALSSELASLMRSFAAGKIEAEVFAIDYIVGWKEWRDARAENSMLPNDPQNDLIRVNILNRVFTACDSFNPGLKGSRSAWNIDGKQLLAEVTVLLSEFEEV